MSSASTSIISVPDGHIALILMHDDQSSFYLEVPLSTINSLCVKPLKYLLYLGWCVLGVEGGLALQFSGSGIDENGGLDNGGIYYYVTATDAGTLYPHGLTDIALNSWCTYCLTQIILMPLTSRSSKRGPMCLRKLRGRAKTFANVYWNVMLVVCGQGMKKSLEVLCILSPSSEAPKYVQQSCFAKIADGKSSGFGSSWIIVQVTTRMSQSYAISTIFAMACLPPV
jgi:hypothetical protein